MKKEYVKILLSIILVNLLFAIKNYAQTSSDSNKYSPSLSSEKILNLSTLWSTSENAAGLQFYNIQQKIARAQIDFQNQNGNFKRFQEADKNISSGFFTNGYVKLNTWKFYGEFNYFNETNKGIKFTDVLEPTDNNPYTLGNKVGGTYHKEYFKMRGNGAWQAGKNISVGFNINYKTAVGARRKDPRPGNLLTEFDIKPGIVLTLSKSRIGTNFHYTTGKEDISLETVTDSIYDFFHFRGLGVFTSTTETDDRSSESELFGAGLQYNFNGNRLKNLTELTFSRKTINIKRGNSFPLQVVLFEHFNTNVTSSFMLSASAKKINKIIFQFNDHRFYGHEPVVEPKLQQESYQWNTIAKYTLYWQNQQNLGVNYSFYKLINQNHFDWGTQLGAKINTSETTYYFVPEFNRQKTNYFELFALLEKEFQQQKNQIIIQAESGFSKGFNSWLEMVNDQVLLENVNTEFAKHDFDYFNESMFYTGGKLNFGKEMQTGNSVLQVFSSIQYKHFISNLNNKTNKNQLIINIGVNF